MPAGRDFKDFTDLIDLIDFKDLHPAAQGSGRVVKQKKPGRIFLSGLKRRLPTLPRENRSTIGVSELNFSVRNGKRWNLTTITT